MILSIHWPTSLRGFPCFLIDCAKSIWLNCVITFLDCLLQLQATEDYHNLSVTDTDQLLLWCSLMPTYIRCWSLPRQKHMILTFALYGYGCDIQGNHMAKISKQCFINFSSVMHALLYRSLSIVSQVLYVHKVVQKVKLLICDWVVRFVLCHTITRL